MKVSGNGLNSHPYNVKKMGSSPRLPRRVVLLTTDEQSMAAEILAEYQGSEVSGNRLHGDVQRLAAEHPGGWVAAEWLGPLGWTRFLWCRR